MPRSKDRRSYPLIFEKLLRTAVVSPTEVKLPPFKSKAEAMSFRFEAYAYIECCMKDTNEEYRQLAVMGKNLCFSIRGNILTVISKDNMEQYQAIDNFLDTLEDGSSESHPAPIQEHHAPSKGNKSSAKSGNTEYEPQDTQEMLKMYETKKPVPTTEELMERMKGKKNG